MSSTHDRQSEDPSGATAPHFTWDGLEHENPIEAWEEVEAGRFMPRRVRGSCTGRALG
ncbi:MAG: hypothetical protein KDB22_14315 [Planctomycetales bacterium]|nr:hypothetical protein [Planctomycetales bacterium]